MIILQNIFQFLSLLISGLITGLLFGYSCSVNPGLGALTAKEYVKAMQSINLAIQNPYFLIPFTGLLFVYPITTYLIYRQQTGPSYYLMISAMSTYFIAVFGITLCFNVPLNNRLATFDLGSATSNEIFAMRQTFEKPWNTFHTIRTVASIVSFGLTILAIIKQKSNL